MAGNEIWKDVRGYEGCYLVSSEGRVKSLVGKTPGLLRKLVLRPDGYIDVQLKVGQKPVNRLVHTLVDEAFNGQREAGLEVNHCNGIKSCNQLDNLERVSRSGNALHAIATGLKTVACGERHGRARLTEAEVLEFRKRAGVPDSANRFARGMVSQLAREAGMSRSAMRSALTGEHWTPAERSTR